MKIITLFILFFLFSLQATAKTYECIATKLKDTCVAKKADQSVVEPFSNDYKNAILNSLGGWIVDGSQGAAKGAGILIAETAAGLILPKEVLVLAGIGSTPEMSNGQLLDEISALIDAQTHTIIKGIEDNNEVINELFISGLMQDCVYRTIVDYESTLESIDLWNRFTTSLKSKDYELGNLKANIEELSNYRTQYGKNSENFCFYGQHVERFSWMMNLIAYELNTRSNYQNIVDIEPSDKHQNLIEALRTIKIYASKMISAFEQSHQVSDNTISNKDNFIWDDVLLESSSPMRNDPEDWDCKDPLDGLMHATSFKDTAIAAQMQYQGSGVSRGYPGYEKCVDDHIFYINEEPYRLTRYILTKEDSSCYDERGCSRGSKHVLVAEHILEANTDKSKIDSINNPFFVSKGCYESNWRPTYTLNCNTFDEFRTKIFSYQQDLDYAFKLQSTYLPHVQFLDSLWENVGETRPENKFDQELLRVSGAFSLDNDDLNILEEIQLGSDPRHSSDETQSDYRIETLRWNGLDYGREFQAEITFSAPGSTECKVYWQNSNKGDFGSSVSGKLIWISTWDERDRVGAYMSREERDASILKVRCYFPGGSMETKSSTARSWVAER